MKTRSDKVMSLQFGTFGRITQLNEENFRLRNDEEFLICNEGDDDVELDVINANGELIRNCRFRPGYDPRIIKKILKTEDDILTLIWGN
jgi:hypothetical protein